MKRTDFIFTGVSAAVVAALPLPGKAKYLENPCREISLQPFISPDGFTKETFMLIGYSKRDQIMVTFSSTGRANLL